MDPIADFVQIASLALSLAAGRQHLSEAKGRPCEHPRGSVVVAGMNYEWLGRPEEALQRSGRA